MVQYPDCDSRDLRYCRIGIKNRKKFIEITKKYGAKFPYILRFKRITLLDKEKGGIVCILKLRICL